MTQPQQQPQQGHQAVMVSPEQLEALNKLAKDGASKDSKKPLSAAELQDTVAAIIGATDDDGVKKLVKDNSSEAKRSAKNLRHLIHHDLPACTRAGYWVEENSFTAWGSTALKAGLVGVLGFLGYERFFGGS